MIKLIMAMDANGAIGLDNSLPWRLPADLKYFKQVTQNNIVVMGRNTFESLPNGPLKDRHNIVLSRDPEPTWAPECVQVYSSMFKLLKDYEGLDIYIIGGKKVYQSFMPAAQRLYVTHIHEQFKADTFMEIDWSKWTPIWTKTGIIDEKNQLPHSFIIYEKL